MQSIRITLLITAVILIAISAIAIACAPAAPSNQGGESENAPAPATPGPTPTPKIGDPVPSSPGTPPAIYLPNPEGTLVPHEFIDPPLTPPVLNSYLKKKIEKREATQEARRSTGDQAHVENEIIWIIISVDSDKRVDEVVKYLEKKSLPIVGTGKNRSFIHPSVIAIVRISMLREISELEGVLRIEKVEDSAPSSSNQRTQPKPSAQSLVEKHGVDTWHTANIQGQTIEVGVIDSGFEGFSTEIAPKLAETVIALCFPPDVQNPDDPDAPSETPDPTNTLSDCEHGTEHGTNVVEKLIAIAPKAKLYISNPRNSFQLKQAVNWMTAKNQDNERRLLGGYRPEIGPTPSYDETLNNDFNIKVINHSKAYLWDGPGDGSSRSTESDVYSPLDSADYAISNGAIWVNPAGNQGERTWFSRDITYNANFVKFDPAVDISICNMVKLKADHDYTFQLRWAGPWPGADQDLDLYLFGPVQSDGLRQVIAESATVQNGDDSDEPFETITVEIETDADYCLFVRNKHIGENPNENPDENPDWMQLQLYEADNDDEAALRSVLNRLGGIGNPAENDGNSMLTIGDASSLANVANVRIASSRGPVPEPIPNGRIEPDVVAITTNPSGTSFAAPVVAGMAALVIQALGNRVGDGYNDNPHEIVNYIKTKAVPLGTGRPNNEYGYGLAKLPGLDDPPTNLVLTHQPCNRDAHLLLTFDPPDWDGINEDGTNVRYTGYARLDPGIPGEVSQVEGIHTVGEDSISFTTVRDATYYAVAEICPINGSSRMCSIPSQRSNYVTVPPEVCAPEHVSGVPGDGMLTVRWNHERHATSYDVQQEHGTAIEVLENQHKVFSNLTNGTTYRFRVRAKGIPGTSEWSEWMTAVPEPTAPTKVQQIRSYSNSDIYIRMHWDETPGNAIYKVQQWDRTAKSWRKLPYEEKGQPEEYQIHFFYTYAGAQAKVTGLTPGKTYTYRFKSLNGSQESDWSDQVNFTAGPTSLHPDHTATPNKSEPRDLALSLSGTNVVLNWTKGENENFATQLVRRKIHEGGPTSLVEFPVTLDAETYTDTTTVSGNTYLYRIANIKNNTEDVISNVQYITVP